MGHVAGKGEEGTVNNIFVGRPEGQRPFKNLRRGCNDKY